MVTWRKCCWDSESPFNWHHAPYLRVPYAFLLYPIHKANLTGAN